MLVLLACGITDWLAVWMIGYWLANLLVGRLVHGLGGWHASLLVLAPFCCCADDSLAGSQVGCMLDGRLPG